MIYKLYEQKPLAVTVQSLAQVLPQNFRRKYMPPGLLYTWQNFFGHLLKNGILDIIKKKTNWLVGKKLKNIKKNEIEEQMFNEN